ncbi:MAG TPA: sensor histidine kinase [Candidatus Stackebrandtia faecavium]|nr:sensor histidine kinase [Candidatus Stackebrandtia faecavium]
MTDVEPSSGVSAPRRVRAWLARHTLIADVLFAASIVLVTASLWLISWVASTQSGIKPLALGDLALLAVGCAPIALRRYRLWWSVLAVMGFAFLSVELQPIAMSTGFTSAIITYTAAAYRPMKRAVLFSGGIWMATTVATFLPGYDDLTLLVLAVSLLVTYVFLSLSFAVGRVVHTRRVNFHELQERARLAEENQAVQVAQAVDDERRRIARELHDVVAHHISVMNVMATGARRTLTKDPRRADEALATIETTGRSTLREMRRLLDVLRTSDVDENEDEMTPQPSLEAVHELVAQIRDAGLPIDLTISGHQRALDPGIALTVFRIVQECLTNTLKHAGQAKAAVLITFGHEDLSIEVTDNGLGPTTLAANPSRVGHGLVGMRERVALYGGRLRTGPRPGGGFRVYAQIPIDDSSSGGMA